ncbi:MAG: hypothetical protein WCZ66_11365 [Sphingomonadaceae bacterium]
MPAIEPPPPDTRSQTLHRLHPGPAIRRRTIVDAALIVGVTIIVSAPAGDPLRALGFGALAVVVGLVYFVVRRSNDLAALVHAAEWRDADVADKGVSLAEWQAGAVLAPWVERSAHPLEKRA